MSNVIDLQKARFKRQYKAYYINSSQQTYRSEQYATMIQAANKRDIERELQKGYMRIFTKAANG